VAVAVLAVLVGCGGKTSNPHLALRYEKGWDLRDLDAILERAPAGDTAVVSLGRTAWVSHHLAVVRTEEQPHYHRFHDLTVVLLRGEGVLNVEQKRIAMKAGDVVHVQRGVPHFFRNGGKAPAAAFVVFSPPFDGRDTITAEMPAEKKEAPGETGDEEKGRPSAEKPASKAESAGPKAAAAPAERKSATEAAPKPVAPKAAGEPPEAAETKAPSGAATGKPTPTRPAPRATPRP
jgi:mannose-6-phosphate isomerase-like protein (cupin superfamily)